MKNNCTYIQSNTFFFSFENRNIVTNIQIQLKVVI